MALEGSLLDLPLIDLLRLFQRSERSGRLLLWNSSEWAMFWFQNGQPAHAVVLSQQERRSVAVGEGAVMHALGWRDGSFRFLGGSVEQLYPVTITRPSTALIVAALEGEPERAVRLLPSGLSLETPLRLLPHLAGAPDGVRLSAHEWLVLSKIEPGATVGKVAALTGLSCELTMHVVARLLALGLLTTTPLTVIPARHLTLEPPLAVGERRFAQPSVSNLTRAIRRRLDQLGAARA